MLFGRLGDGEADQQQAQQHGRKTRQTQQTGRQRKNLAQQVFRTDRGKKPGYPFDHQNYANNRQQKIHLNSPQQSLTPIPAALWWHTAAIKGQRILVSAGQPVKKKEREEVPVR